MPTGVQSLNQFPRRNKPRLQSLGVLSQKDIRTIQVTPTSLQPIELKVDQRLPPISLLPKISLQNTPQFKARTIKAKSSIFQPSVQSPVSYKRQLLRNKTLKPLDQFQRLQDYSPTSEFNDSKINIGNTPKSFIFQCSTKPKESITQDVTNPTTSKRPSIVIEESQDEQKHEDEEKKVEQATAAPNNVDPTTQANTAEKQVDISQDSEPGKSQDEYEENMIQLRPASRRYVQRESYVSNITHQTDMTENDEEEFDVWDNSKDVRVAAAVSFEDMNGELQIESFLKFYKMRFGGFPGNPESISNENVIGAVVQFAKGNKSLLKKYFPTKQVIFNDENDYSKPYDQNSDQNFHQFKQFFQSKNSDRRLPRINSNVKLKEFEVKKASLFRNFQNPPQDPSQQ